ncbi:hypothetical protein BGW80DRAFT_1305950 [Lactifluus volemus]|nr:hypothetical protein BGW80DRAFT_1305950 [Lactifluus volemus]
MVHTTFAKSAFGNAAGTSTLTQDSILAPSKVTKLYVVPEWARTTTATQPRMSAEALERKRSHRCKSCGQVAIETGKQPCRV